MRKMICDVCGKEIKDTRDAWNLNIAPNIGVRGLRYGQTNYSTYFGDICKDCTNSIYHYIKGLTKEDNT